MLRVPPKLEGGIIEGDLRIDRFQLPLLDRKLIDLEIENLTSLLSSPANFDSEYFTTLLLEGKASISPRSYINGSLITRRWEGKNLIIATTAEVTIENSNLKNCLLISTAPIRITGDSKMEYCEIFAPILTIDGNPRISGTIISPDITISGGSLNGVTIYACGDRVRVTIQQATVTGGLFAIGRGKVKIGTGTTCQGLIHATMPVMVKGKIEGYLWATRLDGEEAGKTNQNILEGVIVPPPFSVITPLIYEKIGKLQIIPEKYQPQKPISLK